MQLHHSYILPAPSPPPSRICFGLHDFAFMRNNVHTPSNIDHTRFEEKWLTPKHTTSVTHLHPSRFAISVPLPVTPPFPPFVPPSPPLRPLHYSISHLRLTLQPLPCPPSQSLPQSLCQRCRLVQCRRGSLCPPIPFHPVHFAPCRSTQACA